MILIPACERRERERERDLLGGYSIASALNAGGLSGSLRLTAADSLFLSLSLAVCVCVCHLKFIALYPCLLNLFFSSSCVPCATCLGWCCFRLSSRLRRRRAGTSGRSRSPTRILWACLRSKLPSIGEGPGWLCSLSLSLSPPPFPLSFSGWSCSLSFSLSSLEKQTTIYGEGLGRRCSLSLSLSSLS